MKTNDLIIYIFTDEWNEFQIAIEELIKDSLEFTCNIYKPIDTNNISFSKSGKMKIEWEVEDGESNGGYLSTIFDSKGLISVRIYFQYEDGNEYKEVLYRRDKTSNQ